MPSDPSLPSGEVPSLPAQVRLLVPDDWRLYRDVRLAMLQESPGAFVVTFAQASGYDEQTWRSRLTTTDHFLATMGDPSVGERSVGSVGISDAFGIEQPGDLVLIAMWVAPEARGRGVGALLVSAAIDQARRRDVQRILLTVVETNLGARRLYERMGFAATGVVTPYVHEPAVGEVQMSLLL
jgi:ribosomal protein S18 acetylase RimI-like enzyme